MGSEEPESRAMENSPTKTIFCSTSLGSVRLFPHTGARHTEDIVWHQGKAGSEMLESSCHSTCARLKKKKKGKFSFSPSALTLGVRQDRIRGGRDSIWKRSRHCLESWETKIDVC